MAIVRPRTPRPKRRKIWRGEQTLCTVMILLTLFLLLLNFEYYKTYGKNQRKLFPPELQLQRASTTFGQGRVLKTSKNHTKWIVVTSIFSPTQQIKKLSKIPGWKLLVVADKKTPSDWTHPNVILLDIHTQLTLGYRILEYLPWNSYTRKVIGYLYAIQHGAQFIYDTDDDNAPNNPKDFEKCFAFGKTSRGLVLNGSESVVANPYVHFGQPTVWPRGFPLEYIGQTYNNTYFACPIDTPIIQQGLVNGDPDVDAIFRLTRKQLHTPLNILFDKSAPPIVLPKSIMAPFNSQNTLFHYDAFWALLLSISVSSRVTDIWRGYWAQNLLWRIGEGGHLGFYPPQTTQIRNPHIYLQDFKEEDQLYTQAGNLSQFLAEWKCDVEELYPCMVALTSAMTKLKIWSEIEIELVEAWILDLKSIGYKGPKFSDSNSSPSHPCIKGKNQAIVIFSPAEMQKRKDYRIPLRKFCNLNLAPQNPMIFPSTLLVVTYNHPHYENIWLLDSIYRPHYPNILYCGQLEHIDVLYKLFDSKEFMEAGVTKFSFINASIRGNYSEGLFGYECGMRAIEMNYNVKGYLMLSDDVLLNFWNTQNLNLEEAWFPTNIISKYNLVTKENLDNWPGWEPNWYKFATAAIQKSLKKIYSSTSQYVQQFRRKRDSYGYNATMAMHAFADIFYFPESKQDMFYEVGSILREFEVHLEIANPFLVTGLSSPKNIVNLPGQYIWGDDRSRVFDYFNRTDGFLHPVKSGEIFQNPTLKKQFCEKYVSSLLAHAHVQRE